MRSLLLGVPLMLLVAAMQSTLMPGWRLPGGGMVDLALVLTLAWTIAGDWPGGMAWGFAGGLFLDVLSGGLLGRTALALVLMAYLASLSEGRFWRSHVLLPLGLGVAGSVGYHGLLLAALWASGTRFDWGQTLSLLVVPSTLLNTLCILPAYYLLRWVHARLYPAQVKE